MADKPKDDVYVEEGELRKMRDPRTGQIKEVDLSLPALSRTMENIRKSAEIITGCKYKSPIVVSGSKRLIFFPTSSPRLKSVSWINMMNIDRVYYNALKKVTVIVFQNDVLLELKVSLNILNNQILKSMQLEHYLRKKRYNRV